MFRTPRHLGLVSILLFATLAACAPQAPAPSRNAAWKSTTAPNKTAPPPRQASTPINAPSAQPRPAAPAGQPLSPPPAMPDQAAPDAAPGTGALAPTGIGSLNWGIGPESTPGLGAFGSSGDGVTTYIWPQGPKDVAGAPIRDAYYEFFQNRFYHVWFDLDGLAAYQTALAGLTRAYGPPTDDRPEKYYHAWTLGDVNIYCAFHPAYNEGDVSFFYQPIYDRMMAARKAKGTAGAPKKGKS